MSASVTKRGTVQCGPDKRPFQPTEMEEQGGDAFWENMTVSGRQEVEVGGRLLRPGSRVRLRPGPGVDILDAALAGRLAVIEGIDEDDAGAVHIAVLLDDNLSRDLGEARHPAHRYFFTPSEVEPVEAVGASPLRRVLVAGIGNIFFGDDGFGVAVAELLLRRPLPMGVEVADFGIRGMDLAYALGRGYDGAILVDAVSRRGQPGTLFVIQPEHDERDTPLNGHHMDPLAVLALASRLGQLPSNVLILGCEPCEMGLDRTSESGMRLSSVVSRAVDRAADMALELAADIIAAHP